MTILLLFGISVVMVWLMERHATTRAVLQKLAASYMQGTCRSFIFDIPLLLPLVGMVVEWLWRQLGRNARLRYPLYALALVAFLAVSGSLYFDLISFSAVAPVLGHPEAWEGNHFMWNSGVEIIGMGPLVIHDVPTYRNFWGFWNVFAMFLFAVVYPLIMIKAGTWLYGILFGYTEKQTGVSALFWERKMR